MKSSKFEVVRSDQGGCYLCLENNQELYLAREIRGGRLTALCSRCLLGNLDDFMLDNTREWPFSQGQ
ncbi:hypothetical protein [Desulfoferrobacter suflitae]|uniref:hypothetical protein n=1 Tax=Desulfoferrobacter suflitae TaxID=2865782 RepID=UPI00216486A9|nr:hypothetical protein [Desulfoferrobacter suflitae]MCK8601930.1 hypothetical protein [Desulfoferrobacter suflitae]